MTIDFIHLKFYSFKQENQGRKKGVTDMRNSTSMNQLSVNGSYFRFMKARYVGRTHHSPKLSD